MRDLSVDLVVDLVVELVDCVGSVLMVQRVVVDVGRFGVAEFDTVDGFAGFDDR